jgi:hypothetical protein
LFVQLSDIKPIAHVNLWGFSDSWPKLCPNPAFIEFLNLHSKSGAHANERKEAMLPVVNFHGRRSLRGQRSRSVRRFPFNTNA